MDKHLNDIRELIENDLVDDKKREISKNVSKLMTYYNVGKLLVTAQGGEERAKYGNKLIKQYSTKLTKEFGSFYSDRTLRHMRQFYLTYKIWKPVVSKLDWSHHLILLPIKNESKRNYYINSCIEHGFSKRQLIDYIKSNAYERLLNHENIELKYLDNKQDDNLNILDIIKDPILISIEKSTDKITERALKKFMIENIEKTILELGKGFYFGGSEKPIKINGKTHRPDLIFFNTELNAHVIFEIKLKELRKIDISQIEFYVNYYDAEIKKLFHNPTIGITISKKVDREMLKYIEKDNIEHTTYEIVS